MIGKMTKSRKINAPTFSVVFSVAVALMSITVVAETRPGRFEAAPREADEPIMAIVSIKSQQVTFYDAKGWILRAPVSTGTSGRETPAGIFAIVEKNKEHRSNMYDDAKMPHMQRITWNGIAMHGGPLPGYAASHGCVRMPFDFAAMLFNKTRIGMRVIISPYDTAPIDIFHPTLFSPDAEVVAAAPERADMLKRQAEEASNGFKEAKKSAKARAREVTLQERSLRRLEARKKSADARLRRADEALSSADKAKARAYERLQRATAEATEATTQLTAATTTMDEKVATATAATATVAETTQTTEQAKKVELSAAHEVEQGKETLAKLEGLKKSADTALKLAEQTLSAADEARAQAEGQLRKISSEVAKLTAQIEAAESDLKEKVAVAAAATTAADAAAKRSDEAKNIEESAAHMVALRKATLDELKSLNDGADATPELAAQIKSVESDLNTRTVTAAVVAKIAGEATQRSDEAKRVEMAAANEVALRTEALGKLESLKEKADAELRRAEEELSTANDAKAQAEERLRKATAETAELATQIKGAASDLQAKVVAYETATTAANDAAQTNDEAKRVEKSAIYEVALQKKTLGKLEGIKRKAESGLRRADEAFSAADKTKTRAEERLRKATAEATDLGQQVDTAKSDLSAKIAAAAAAKDAVKAAKIKKGETAQAALDAKLALEPVSVYISRATQRLYVRRNTHKPAIDGGGEEFDSSIEVPITIYDPDKPIGTHIFTAMEHNDGGLRWTVVTIDNREDPRRALDRITIPQEVFERVALTALPRSSIIISDEPLNKETNYRTEFIAVLSDQPQGGFITRKVTQNRDVEESDFGGSNAEDGGAEKSDFVLQTPSFLGL